MNLKVTRKSSQSYSMKQQPSVHIKLPGRHGISSPFSIGSFEKLLVFDIIHISNHDSRVLDYLTI